MLFLSGKKRKKKEKRRRKRTAKKQNGDPNTSLRELKISFVKIKTTQRAGDDQKTK